MRIGVPEAAHLFCKENLSKGIDNKTWQCYNHLTKQTWHIDGGVPYEP